MRPSLSDLAAFPVERIGDNRMRGLLQELAEALEQEDDPALLRAVGQSLKMLGDFARSQAFTMSRIHW